MDFGGHSLVYSAIPACLSPGYIEATQSSICCKLLALIFPKSPPSRVLGILGALK